jgi:hypothetical protein
VSNARDDDRLLAALRAAVAARAAVPAAFVEAAKNAYAWHNVDAELAELAYDSRRDRELSAAMRSEDALIRALSFHSSRFSIEVEVTGDALLGQLVPAQAGTAEIQTQASQTTTTEIDQAGRFAIEPKPHGPFRMRLRTEGNPDVVTGRLALLSSGGDPMSGRVAIATSPGR